MADATDIRMAEQLGLHPGWAESQFTDPPGGMRLRAGVFICDAHKDGSWRVRIAHTRDCLAAGQDDNMAHAMHAAQWRLKRVIEQTSDDLIYPSGP